MKEIWKDIPGFNGHYRASTLGRIKRVRTVYGTTYRGKPFNRRLKPKILSGPKLTPKGYKRVNLVSRVYFIHRLVALTFIPPIDGRTAINHKNGIKTDNRVCNLEWVSNKENSRHAMRLGLLNVSGITKHKKIFERHKKQILSLLKAGVGHKEIGAKFGVKAGAISKIGLKHGLRRKKTAPRFRGPDSKMNPTNSECF